jgi:hypothetical protein
MSCIDPDYLSSLEEDPSSFDGFIGGSIRGG